jgi:hypothetical protein
MLLDSWNYRLESTRFFFLSCGSPHTHTLSRRRERDANQPTHSRVRIRKHKYTHLASANVHLRAISGPADAQVAMMEIKIRRRAAGSGTLGTLSCQLCVCAIISDTHYVIVFCGSNKKLITRGAVLEKRMLPGPTQDAIKKSSRERAERLTVSNYPHTPMGAFRMCIRSFDTCLNVLILRPKLPRYSRIYNKSAIIGRPNVFLSVF